MASGVVVLNGQSYLLVNDDDGGSVATGVRGSDRKQDLTPSTHDANQGIPGDTDIASGSTIVYGDATGALGLSDRTLAPGDLSRPFLSEADNTRMRQITAWVGTATGVGISDTGAGIFSPFTHAMAVVDAGSGFGLIYQDTVSSGVSSTFWQMSSTTLTAIRSGYTNVASMALAGYTPRSSYGWLGAMPQVVQDYAGGLWYAAVGGLVNAAVAAAAPAGDAASACTVKYLDMLWSFGLTATGITITPYRFTSGQTPATAGARVQKIDTGPGSATYGTAINTTDTISGEYAILGVIAAESNVFLVTDHSLYRIGWEDGPNVFTHTRLPVEVPAFTSNPVWWNGELWVGAGNQIVHVVPGQRWADIVTVDQIGNMPQPFSGRVVQLVGAQQYLVAKLVTDLTVATPDTALVVRNADGAWYNRRLIQGNAATALLPLLQKLDANGYALATVTSQTTVTSWPLLGAGKNPRNLAVSIRGQEGIERIIWPWEYGEEEAALKQLKRCRLQVTGVGGFSSANHVKAYSQTDNRDELALVPDQLALGGQATAWTPGGIGKGTGGWALAADAYQSAKGEYGSQLTSSGTGYVWTEFDGTDATYFPADVTAGAITAFRLGGNPEAGGVYASAPSVLIFPLPGFGGAGATATATVAGGKLTAITVTAGGSGYTDQKAFAILTGGKADGGSGLRGTTIAAGGVLPYPTFRRIRWMVEIGGDTTGTLVPTFVALLWQFNEYSKVEYQIAWQIRMRVGDTQITNGTKVDGSVKSKYNSAADVVADRDALEALKNQHLTVPATSLDGHTWTVYVTKVSHETISADSTGIQESVTSLTLQIVPLQGTV